LVGAFRSRVSLEAENTILRHQLNVLRRKSPKRLTFGMLDRLAGSKSLATKSGIATVHTERYLFAAFDRLAFETARPLRVHPGKTHTQNG